MLRHPGMHILGWVLAFFLSDMLFGWMPHLLPESVSNTIGYITLGGSVAVLMFQGYKKRQTL